MVPFYGQVNYVVTTHYPGALAPVPQGPISLTDLSLFWGLNQTQSDSWLSLSLFVKMAPGSVAVGEITQSPGLVFTKGLSQVLGLNSIHL